MDSAFFSWETADAGKVISLMSAAAVVVFLVLAAVFLFSAGISEKRKSEDAFYGFASLVLGIWFLVNGFETLVFIIIAISMTIKMVIFVIFAILVYYLLKGLNIAFQDISSSPFEYQEEAEERAPKAAERPYREKSSAPTSENVVMPEREDSNPPAQAAQKVPTPYWANYDSKEFV